MSPRGWSAAAEMRIIFVHMVPSFMSHIIAATTLALPAMILSETALSFLGLGLRPPAISWGVLLQEAQNVQTVALVAVAAVAGRAGDRRGPGLQLPGRRPARRRRPVLATLRPCTRPLLSVRESEDPLLPGRGHGQGGRRRQLRHGAGRDARHRRRERLRQERHRALDPADRRAPGADRRRRDPLPPAGTQRRAERRSSTWPTLDPNGPRDARDPRRRDRADLPGADDLAQPGAHDRQPDHRGDPAASARRPSARRARRRIEMLRRVGMPRPSSASTSYPHPAERRPAPARDDRDGALVQPDAADRRRADHRAGRDHRRPRSSS